MLLVLKGHLKLNPTINSLVMSSVNVNNNGQRKFPNNDRCDLYHPPPPPPILDNVQTLAIYIQCSRKRDMGIFKWSIGLHLVYNMLAPGNGAGSAQKPYDRYQKLLQDMWETHEAHDMPQDMWQAYIVQDMPHHHYQKMAGYVANPCSA